MTVFRYNYLNRFTSGHELELIDKGDQNGYVVRLATDVEAVAS